MEQTHTYKFYAKAGKVLLIGFGAVVVLAFALYGITSWGEAPGYFALFIVLAALTTPIIMPLFFRWLFRRPFLVIDAEGITDKTNAANSRHKITWDELESFNIRRVSGSGYNPAMTKIILYIKDISTYTKKRGALAKFFEALRKMVEDSPQGSIYVRADLLKAEEHEVTNAIIDASNGKVRRRGMSQQ